MSKLQFMQHRKSRKQRDGFPIASDLLYIKGSFLLLCLELLLAAYDVEALSESVDVVAEVASVDAVYAVVSLACVSLDVLDGSFLLFSGVVKNVLLAASHKVE